MWRISIHHDFDALGVPFHPVVVIGLGKNLLFKFVLAHCVLQSFQKRNETKTLTNLRNQFQILFHANIHQSNFAVVSI